MTDRPPPRTDCCAPRNTELMPGDRASTLAALFKALADPSRVRLLSYLASARGGTVCACHLPGELGISQPTLSHHLKKLVDAGIITREQRGRWAHYAVVPERLDLARTYLGESLNTSPDDSRPT
ncbi:transcriptional regulator, ArsR family [Austwickia chelonae]|uniref:Putative ArsR family transcriptional regulator n=1 Tax=Austwickia chelonae NBRC 105200 TaxID=1184607 RepID=K6V980_9MICO|nr:metalloregulator ArsR/SmtB family transcription factor [Austwickia chelonae]GAB78793.1 putative ArsR family transcriptional regulator [Austwickia chelonae NBRC 105200]SEV84347.1 transcriptional regulator, ArsR family [Austwickia chelonae]